MPNLLAVLSAPSTTDLVTLAQVKEALGIPTGDEKDHALLERCIRGASAYFVRRLGRPLVLQTVTEGFPLTDRLRLVLGLRPVVSVSAVRIDGDALASDEYSLEDKAVGFLYRASGWGGQDGRVARGISQDVVVERGELRVQIDYRAGYFLPGMTPPIGVGEMALPGDLTDAVLDLVQVKYGKRDRDLAASSVRIGDFSASYSDREVPEGVAAVADAYADAI